jgi:hypothetical protein
MMTTISMRDAKRLYDYGNDHGCGYAPYSDVPGPDTIDAAVEAAEADGWTVTLDRHTSDEIVVLEQDGELLGIGGDAMGCGAWAVPISDQVAALAAWDASQAEPSEVAS